ncbi:MAG: glucose 1-dehydrogenase [Acidobacteriota bacterium]
MIDIFKDKVVIVTGSTSGIGQACSKQFAEGGAKVILAGRDIKALEILKKELNTGPDCNYIPGDITDADYREKLIDFTLETYGKLDILVNSAGIIASGTIEDTSMDEFDKMMDINLRSIFHLVKLAIPHLEISKGNIVNVSSITGSRVFPGIIAYCVSKAGLDQFTRAAALELASKNIRVNGINPGVVETNLHLRSGMSEDKYIDFKEHGKTTHPLGRIGQPEEIANLITFLASDKAKWITGVNYGIDGGRQLTCAR